MKKLTASAALVLALSAGLTERTDAAALSLDGVDDWVDLSATATGVFPSGNAPFTIGAWVNPDVHSNSTITFWGNQASQQANGFRLKSGEGLRHYFWGNDNDQTIGDIASNTSGPNGDGWHQLAVVFDGTNDQWYWNGAPVGAARNTGGVVNVADANHRIGSRLGAEFFDGLIDEITVWGVALSAADIAGGWNQPIDYSDPGVQGALIAHYDFENGLTDSSALGGAQNGVAMGGATIDLGANAPFIPEPSSGLLGLLGVAFLFRRRR